MYYEIYNFTMPIMFFNYNTMYMYNTGSNTATPGSTPAVFSACASAGTALLIQGASVGKY